jgi:hypothetical protein
METNEGTLQVGGFSISAEGIYNRGYEWQITLKFDDPLVATRRWVREEYLMCDSDLSEMLWEEANHILYKNAVMTFSEGLIEEEED